MFISEKGLELIKQFEGCRLISYDDYNNQPVYAGGEVIGTLTIGYGHTYNVIKGQEITNGEATEMLREDMNSYCNDVQSLIDNGTIQFTVTQNMFDALTSFDYNLGKGNLIQLVKDSTIETVANEMLLYINKGSVWEEGLLRRRTIERDLLLEGYVKPTPQAIKPMEYDEIGQAEIITEVLNVRSAPNTISTENIVATYNLGDTFNYQYVIIANGYVWCRYVSDYTNTYRYVAVKDLATNERYANCY